MKKVLLCLLSMQAAVCAMESGRKAAELLERLDKAIEVGAHKDKQAVTEDKILQDLREMEEFLQKKEVTATTAGVTISKQQPTSSSAYDPAVDKVVDPKRSSVTPLDLKQLDIDQLTEQDIESGPEATVKELARAALQLIYGKDHDHEHLTPRVAKEIEKLTSSQNPADKKWLQLLRNSARSRPVSGSSNTKDMRSKIDENELNNSSILYGDLAVLQKIINDAAADHNKKQTLIQRGLTVATIVGPPLFGTVAALIAYFNHSCPSSS